MIDASNVKIDYLPSSLKKNNTLKLVLFLLEDKLSELEEAATPGVPLVGSAW